MIIPDPKQWWKYDKDTLLRYIYWERGKLPPTDETEREEAWQKIKKELGDKYGNGQE